ncbi:hypothetical protein Tco_0116374 [Tanacetum coccineum]
MGVGTPMDPTLTKFDRLVGYVLGEVDVYIELEVFFLLGRLLGVNSTGEDQQARVSQLAADKTKSANVEHRIKDCEKNAFSRRHDRYWRLIGWAEIQGGQTIEIPPSSI